MKTFLTIILGAFAFLSSIYSNPTFIVAVTDDLDQQSAGKVYATGAQMLTDIPFGARIRFITGDSRPSLITEYVREQYPNRRVQARELSLPQNALKAYIANGINSRKGQDTWGKLDLPQIMRAVEHLREPGSETTVVLLGNYLWMEDQEFSFVDPAESDPRLRFRRPTHGSLSSSKFLSPFSAEDLPKVPEATVLWMNPMGSDKSGPPIFTETVEEFWALFLKNMNARLAPIQHEPQLILSSLHSNRLGYVEPSLRGNEKPVAMLRLADLMTEAREAAILPAISTVYIIDNSGSQAGVIDTISNRLASQLQSENLNYALVLFGAGGPGQDKSYVHSITNVPEDMARNFRIAPSAGMDSPEALSSALMTTRDLLRERKSKGTAVIIVADVAPVQTSGIPAEETYEALMQELIADNQKPIFVKCQSQQDITWVPEGVQIEDL